jgi:hypothetical protein
MNTTSDVNYGMIHRPESKRTKLYLVNGSPSTSCALAALPFIDDDRLVPTLEIIENSTSPAHGATAFQNDA